MKLSVTISLICCLTSSHAFFAPMMATRVVGKTPAFSFPSLKKAVPPPAKAKPVAKAKVVAKTKPVAKKVGITKAMPPTKTKSVAKTPVSTLLIPKFSFGKKAASAVPAKATKAIVKSKVVAPVAKKAVALLVTKKTIVPVAKKAVVPVAKKVATKKNTKIANRIFDMDLWKERADSNDYGARSKKRAVDGVGKVKQIKKNVGYVPAGLTAAQYNSVRNKDQAKKDANYARNVAKAGIFEDYTDFYKRRGTDVN